MIGIIADDLSGATEIGGVGLRHGLTAEVVTTSDFNSDADLICVDTDSRSCEPEEAARRAAAAARGLAEAGAQWIYKKVDSVMRGRIAVELAALMAECRVRRALLVPANPVRGRVIHNGQYLVQGTPIHLTEFARDPEYPRLSSNVRELLGKIDGISVEVCRASDPLPEAGIVIGEASSREDLAAWAVRRNEGMILAGAGEFFGALLATEHAVPHRQRAFEIPVATGELFVCGSASEATRQFVEEQRAAGAQVFLLPEQLTPAALLGTARQTASALQSGSRTILAIGPRRSGEAGPTSRLAEALVQIATLVLTERHVGRVYGEGGATAAALVRAMGWTRLRLVREVAPGTAALATGPGKPVLLTIKPGSYPGRQRFEGSRYS